MFNFGISEADTVIAKRTLLSLKIYAVLMVGLAIIGAFRAYTPVPYIDMWPGVVGFYEHVLDGDWFAWFSMFSEHPNTIAKLSFWADMHWFSGMGWSLLVTNYAIMAIAATVLCLLTREADKDNAADSARTALYCFIVGSAYYWSQWENFSWGFQVSFFWGQTLPLCAAYFLYKSTLPQAPARNFGLACLLGAAAVGTMANGILALPSLLLVSLTLRHSKKRILALAVLSAAMISLYFLVKHKTVTNQFGNNLISFEALRDNVFSLFVYFCSFLGSPFSYVVGRGPVGRIAAAITGALFLLICAVLVLKNRKQKNTLHITLFGYLFFVLCTGGAAAITRFSLSTPITSRYTTTALLGWLVLLVIYSPSILSLLRKQNKRHIVLLSLLPAAMLVGQTAALKPWQSEHYRRNVETVGMSLGANLQQPGLINPWLTSALAARARRHTIYSIYPYRDVVDQYETILQPVAVRAGTGGLSSVQALPDDAGFLRISGWIYDTQSGKIPLLVRCLDANNMVIGFALTGARDSQASAPAGQDSQLSGFHGYIQASALGGAITLLGDAPLCQLKVQMTPDLMRQ